MKVFKKTGKIIAMASAASLLTITAAMAQEVYVEGWVLPTDSGYELMADSGPNCKLEGADRELPFLVNRAVHITGDLQDGPSGKIIKVHTVEDATY